MTLQGTDTQEFKVEQNTAFVEQAQKGASEGILQDIERRARAIQETVKVTENRVSEAEHKSAGAQGNAEAGVYGSLLTHSLGVGGVTELAGFVDARRTDKAQTNTLGGERSSQTNVDMTRPSKQAQTMDDHIRESVSRKPGVYREEAKQSVYGSTPVADKFVKRTGADIFASAQIAGEALNNQPEDWTKKIKDIPPAKSMASVKMAKEMTFGQEIANELALTSVKVAREHNAAMKGHIQQMAPGFGGMNLNLSLASGPRAPSSAVLGDTDRA